MSVVIVAMDRYGAHSATAIGRFHQQLNGRQLIFDVNFSSLFTTYHILNYYIWM